MKKNFTVIGGGSVNWMKGLMRDLYLIENISGGEIRLVDPKKELAKAVARMLEYMNKFFKKDYLVKVVENRRKALSGADFVLTTFSPGSMDAFYNDLEIPVKYGIRLPVSMTVGIPGISAAIRTAPVMEEIVRDMEEICPGSWLLNVTNPMSVVTKAANNAAKTVKVIGMCHEFHCFGEYMGPILGLHKPDNMGVLEYLYEWLPKQGFDYTVAGINHFIWLTKAELNGENVLPKIREYCLNNKSVQNAVGGAKAAVQATTHFESYGEAKFALCRQFGYLPVAGDRHLIEFYPSMCNSHNGFGDKYHVKKTYVDDRVKWIQINLDYINKIAQGSEKITRETSGEEMTKIIEAIVGGTSVSAIVNMPNQGQIENMPEGAVVETFATVSKAGIKPKMSGMLPGAVGSLCRLHADVHELTLKAALEGDRQLLIEAMSLDPSSGCTDFCEIPALADELLFANREWLPRFFK